MIKYILGQIIKDIAKDNSSTKEYNKLEELTSIIEKLSQSYAARNTSNFADKLANSFISICRFSLLYNNTGSSTYELVKQYEHYSSEQYNELTKRKKSDNIGENIFEIIASISCVPAFEKSVPTGYVEGCCLGLIQNLAKDRNIDLESNIKQKLDGL